MRTGSHLGSNDGSLKLQGLQEGETLPELIEEERTLRRWGVWLGITIYIYIYCYILYHSYIYSILSVIYYYYVISMVIYDIYIYTHIYSRRFATATARTASLGSRS